MTIYIDTLFLLNAILNYLLLLGSARLGGAEIRRRRLLSAAAIGGLYAVGCVVPQLGFFQNPVFKVIVGALMLLTAFSWKRSTIKLGLLFLALSFAFGGLVMVILNVYGTSLMLLNGAAYYPVSGRVLVLTAAAVYILAHTIFARLGEHVGGELVPIELNADARSVKLTALRDSGNTLKDPITNQNVLVAEWQIAKALLPREIGATLTEAQFARPTELLTTLSAGVTAGKWRLIPYRAVGTSGGLLLAMRCDMVQIGKEKQAGGLVAFSPTAVSDGGGYTALVGSAGKS